MRDYKFRAWHKNDNLMLDAVDINTMLILNAGHGLSEDVVLMQYTGLKDKNGKEIYEGDVVKGKRYAGRCEQKRFIGAVNYKLVSFRVDGVGQYEGITYEELHGAYEIIGNIYENAELLAEVTP